MFDDTEKPVSENQVPSPPTPPQPAIKPTEPVVEPPPPTGDSPHMDLPLAPKTPHSTSKIKIILASLAGLILLGAIGYGGWWAYTDYLEGDMSNITKIFGAEEEQEQVVEVDEQDNQIEEEPEVTAEAKRYEFNEKFIPDDGSGDEGSLSGYIDTSEDQKTFNMSIHMTSTLGSEKTQENLEAEFGLFQIFGYMMPIALVARLNSDMKSLNEDVIMPGEENTLEGALYDLEFIDQYKNDFPNFGQSYDKVVNSGATLSDLDFSMELIYADSTYPIMRFRFNDSDNMVTLAMYDLDRQSKSTNLTFSELLEVSDLESLLPVDPETATDPDDAKRIADIKQIQTALELYRVDNENDRYPTSEDALLLNNTLQLCNDGLVEVSVECSGSVIMSQVPQDPGDAYYTYRSPIGTWYEVIFKLSDDYDGGLNLQPGLNVATPDGIVPYGNPEEDDDGDGLINSLEEENGTDVSNRDTDSDGLSDYDEVIWWETDPLNWDTDGDEFGDGEEIHNGFNPLGEGRYFE